MAIPWMAVGFRKPRSASSIIFSATRVVIGWLRSVNPSAPQVSEKAAPIAFTSSGSNACPLRKGVIGTVPQKLLVEWNYDGRYAFQLNAPYFDAAAGETFEGVEVALVALRLYSEQTHFNVANRAEKQRLDGRFRDRLALWKRADVVHGMCAFRDWLLCTFWCLRTCHLSRP